MPGMERHVMGNTDSLKPVTLRLSVVCFCGEGTRAVSHACIRGKDLEFNHKTATTQLDDLKFDAATRCT